MDETQEPIEGEELVNVVFDPEPVPEPEPEVRTEPADWIDGIQRCAGVKKDGTRCQAPVKGMTGYCGFHQDQIPVPEPEPVKQGWPQYKRVLGDGDKVDRHKPYPFHDGGANENAALRMVAMVKPNCPMDSNPEILKRDGTSVTNPRYTGEPNCQLAYRINNQGIWDVQKCISLGHDPYFTVFHKARVEDEVDEAGYITGTRTRILKERRINIDQVSDNPRHSSRMEVPLAMARGLVPLDRFVMVDAEGEFVFDACCEFRGCSAPWRVDTRYGRYCTERHARLVAADFQKRMLPVGGDPYSEDQAMQEREDILASLTIGKIG